MCCAMGFSLGPDQTAGPQQAEFTALQMSLEGREVEIVTDKKELSPEVRFKYVYIPCDISAPIEEVCLILFSFFPPEECVKVPGHPGADRRGAAAGFGACAAAQKVAVGTELRLDLVIRCPSQHFAPTTAACSFLGLAPRGEAERLVPGERGLRRPHRLGHSSVRGRSEKTVR